MTGDRAQGLTTTYCNLGTLATEGEGPRRMVDLTDHQKQQLATLKDRLARVERGEVWGSDHPGPYTTEERAREIGRVKSVIADMEEAS